MEIEKLQISQSVIAKPVMTLKEIQIAEAEEAII
jgi:hypothetical protein